MKNIDEIEKLANHYYDDCNNFLKISKIRKMPNGKYRVLSEKGKNLGTYKSKDSAKKRLKQVEYFKHFDHSNANDDLIIDLTDIEEFSFTAIMRKLRQKTSQDNIYSFLKLFKNEFDKAYKNKLQKPEKIALQNAMIKFNKICKIKLDKKMIKNAAVSELGSAKQIGKYLSDIVKFIIARIPLEKRAPALSKLKEKIFYLKENEIALKNLPDSSALGQSITFVKHVLFNHDPHYIREVINHLVSNL